MTPYMVWTRFRLASGRWTAWRASGACPSRFAADDCIEGLSGEWPADRASFVALPADERPDVLPVPADPWREWDEGTDGPVG